MCVVRCVSWCEGQRVKLTNILPKGMDSREAMGHIGIDTTIAPPIPKYDSRIDSPCNWLSSP